MMDFAQACYARRRRFRRAAQGFENVTRIRPRNAEHGNAAATRSRGKGENSHYVHTLRFVIPAKAGIPFPVSLQLMK
jgi:hypothetical protein